MAEFYLNFKHWLDKNPFLLIVGKYDHILGPRSLFSSYDVQDDNFIRDLLRDALNTTNKYVNLDYNKFYSQICKIDVGDPSARGGKQSYALIFLRDTQLPVISTFIFQQIEHIFGQIGKKRILADDEEAFKKFFELIQSLFLTKEYLMPLESFNVNLRSEISTILGFCDLLIEHKTNGFVSDEDLLSYLKIMQESATELENLVGNMFSSER